MTGRRSDAQPRFATRRRSDRATLGGRWAATAKLLGTPFMPHQQLVADVAGEIDPDTGLPCYRTVIVTMMRQSGKTSLILPVEVDRSVSWGRPQRIVYTAQTGLDARKKLFTDQVPVIRESPLAEAMKTPVRAAGQESVPWITGSRIDLTASGKASGHGGTLDMGVIDEAFHDVDDRREQAMIPAMATRADAQLWITSTAGTAESLYLRRKFEQGREAAMADPGHGTCYFEWSIPDDEDIADEEVWWRYMPALGRTISIGAVRQSHQTMKDAEFRRAFGNQWTEQEDDRLIPIEVWQAVCSSSASPDGHIRFGVEVREDRSGAAIVAAGANDVCEVVEVADGTGWVLERADDMKRWGYPVVIDGRGPAKNVADDLEEAGVRVERMSNDEVITACGDIYDAIAERTVTFRTDERFDEAVKGLAKRTVGDRFVWSRTASTTDIATFMGATLARHDDRGGPNVW